jgi:ferric-dicitrate binding protein FerR (iron transport regulator)
MDMWLVVLASVMTVSLFTFSAVATWAHARRREREAFYRSETLKKAAEGQAGAFVLDLFREEHRLALIRRREGLKLGGLVNIAVGLAFMASIRLLDTGSASFALGLVPLLVGIALIVHVHMFSRSD